MDLCLVKAGYISTRRSEAFYDKSTGNIYHYVSLFEGAITWFGGGVSWYNGIKVVDERLLIILNNQRARLIEKTFKYELHRPLTELCGIVSSELGRIIPHDLLNVIEVYLIAVYPWPKAPRFLEDPCNALGDKLNVADMVYDTTCNFPPYRYAHKYDGIICNGMNVTAYKYGPNQWWIGGRNVGICSTIECIILDKKSRQLQQN